MKFKNSILKTMLAVALVSGVANAQETATEGSKFSNIKEKLNKNLYLGVGLGSAFSYTDIKQYPSGIPVFAYRSEFGYGFNGNYGYQFNNVVSLEGGLSFVRLNGTRRVDQAWFTAAVLQYDLGGRFNLTNLVLRKSIVSRKFDIFLTGGLGMSTFRATRHLLVNGVSTDPVMGIVGYEVLLPNVEDLEKKRRSRSGSVYLGIGAAYRLTSKIDITVDLKGYILQADYLDANISTNPTTDKFNYNSLGIVYRLSARDTVAKQSKDEQLEELLNKFKDTDGDGVADINDKDNKTAKGVKVYADGTSVDTDGDGVADNLDAEKVSPCKEVDATGKAKDSDGDGVADCKDKEPNTVKGSQVDANGKAIASMDSSSPVVGATGATGETGAAGSTPSASTGVASGLPSVFFDLNSSAISYKNYPSLTQVAQYLKANPKAKLVLVGNSDKIGSAEYNKKLSQKRAQAIVDHLVKNNGVDASRLSVVGKGSDEPISTKRNSEQNRRVDFMLTR